MIDIDKLAENYYINGDPQFTEEQDETEINLRASAYVAKACIDAIDDLTEEERRSLADNADNLWATIIDHLI